MDIGDRLIKGSLGSDPLYLLGATVPGYEPKDDILDRTVYFHVDPTSVEESFGADWGAVEEVKSFTMVDASGEDEANVTGDLTISHELKGEKRRKISGLALRFDDAVVPPSVPNTVESLLILDALARPWKDIRSKTKITRTTFWEEIQITHFLIDPKPKVYGEWSRTTDERGTFVDPKSVFRTVSPRASLVEVPDRYVEETYYVPVDKLTPPRPVILRLSSIISKLPCVITDMSYKITRFTGTVPTAATVTLTLEAYVGGTIDQRDTIDPDQPDIRRMFIGRRQVTNMWHRTETSLNKFYTNKRTTIFESPRPIDGT